MTTITKVETILEEGNRGLLLEASLLSTPLIKEMKPMMMALM
jgi:hypothetical protein